MKKLLLKYYFFWFQGHNRSKYAYQFSHHWYHAFLQVCATLSFAVFLLVFCLEKLTSTNLLFSNIKFLPVILYSIVPSILLYVLLFNYYKIDKNNDDPSEFGIEITKRTKVISWMVYILSFVITIGAIQLRGKV
jgi:hypothetical protein